jgi:hypothetical protein
VQRLLREIKIWRKLWELDQGKHIVPLLGVCYFEGPFPYAYYQMTAVDTTDLN